MADHMPVLFCDGIIEANVTHGVVRITLGQMGGDGKAVPCGRLILPLAQLPATATAMTNLVAQVQEKLKEASARSQQAQQAPEGGTAFKFS